MSLRTCLPNFVLLAAAPAVLADGIPCGYDVQVVQGPTIPIFGPANTHLWGINDNGMVVGDYSWLDYSEAFYWTPETGMVVLERPPLVISAAAYDVNNVGQICGTLIIDGVGNRGFVWQEGEWTILLPVLPAGASSASAINSLGAVAGHWRTVPPANPPVACWWSPDGTPNDLGIPIPPWSAATDINDSGTIAGFSGSIFDSAPETRGCVWSKGGLIVLPAIPGGFTSRADGISNGGIVVGSGQIPADGFPYGQRRAFTWDGSEMTRIDPPPPYQMSASEGCNDAGVVVGRVWTIDGDPSPAIGFVWVDGIIHNLNELIPPDRGLDVEYATAINSTGQIACVATDSHSDIVGVILTPPRVPTADLNGDGTVDHVDLGILVGLWGSRDATADLNADGVVDGIDLGLLLSMWIPA